MGVRPNGMVTFLFTDIEGSTRLAQEYPDEMPGLLARHNEILNQAIQKYNGHIFQIVGDSFSAAFHSVSDALNAALDAQHALHMEVWLPAPIKVRMGIHVGMAQLQGEKEYSGYTTLATTQRVMSAGHGGQVLITKAVHDLLVDTLPSNTQFIDMGEHHLKDVIQRQHLYQISLSDLPTEFPPLKTQKVVKHNLPVKLTSFIGRERDLAHAKEKLETTRLLTLTGPGGTGKTRLSIQLGGDLLAQFPDGVWMIELAPISDEALIPQTIAGVFRLRESSDRPLMDTIVEYLHEKKLLLVLDNCEHLIDECARLAENLIRNCHELKVLASSREALGVAGETIHRVPSLLLPDQSRVTRKAILECESVQFLVDRISGANPNFQLTDENASSVALICRRLDGIPLALELAAARAKILSVEQIAERLNDRFRLLTGGSRTALRHQQTLRALVDWSYDLLSESEKLLFARLGIFVGGWTLEFAESVCGKDGSVDVLDGIESLLDKSLINPAEGSSSESRFTMLETIREYAFEKLSQSTELQVIRESHADAITTLVERVGTAVGASDDAYWFARLDDELDNLRSAVEWTLTKDEPTLALRTCRSHIYWHTRLNYREPLRWLEQAFASSAKVANIDKASALNSAGYMYHEMQNLPRAKWCYELALSIFQEIDDPKGIARSLNNLGNMEYAAKNFEKARELYENSLTYEEPDSWGVVMTSINLGNVARTLGDWEVSRKHYLHAREVSERINSETGITSANSWLGGLGLALRELEEARANMESVANAAWIRANPLNHSLTLGWLAYADLLLGRHDEVGQRLKQALEAAYEFLKKSPSLLYPWLLLDGQARVDAMNGNLERAAQLFGAAWKHREEDDFQLTEFERTDFETSIKNLKMVLGDNVFQSLFESGKAMTIKDAIELALKENHQ